ncbi:MAG: PTS system mannose/fructose/sorbose family transporter subunit IID [Calditrichaeota bacterium]|nr:PTS system mannose/fructose/sorbose family transporter subunit IID [Calditrichota bacterium]MCB9368749.1 PTS system mannose/fructose/sorbose family transporter subunit IID [Calditrichota bacterium]
MSDAPKRTTILLRSLALQLFLNYKTMQGPGYLMSLRSELSDHDPEKTRAAGSFINGHPVFSSIALGALAKRLRGSVDAAAAADISEWKRTLSTPLGSIGDSLIWERFKPALLALAAGILLLGSNIAEGLWGWLVLLMMLTYNLALWNFRNWGFERGFELGETVSELALHPALPKVRKFLRVLGIVAASLVIAGTIKSSLGPSPTTWMQFCAGFLLMLGASKLRLNTLTVAFFAILFSFGIYFLNTQTHLLP